MRKSVLLSAVFLSGFLSAKNQTFSGIWKQLDAQTGYESFWLIEEDGSGFLCVADKKSSTTTSIVGDRLEDYDYGTGDRLSLLDKGNLLKREGTDKGFDYQIFYQKTKNVPKWCLDQKNQNLQDDGFFLSIDSYDG